MTTEMPRYDHDCSHCRFLRHAGAYDVYFCLPFERIVFRGSDEPAYGTSLALARLGLPTGEAYWTDARVTRLGQALAAMGTFVRRFIELPVPVDPDRGAAARERCGWDEDSTATLVEGFIEDHGLHDALDAVLDRAAEEEMDEGEPGWDKEDDEDDEDEDDGEVDDDDEEEEMP